MKIVRRFEQNQLASREASPVKESLTTAQAVAWEHTMDNTEGIPGNRPQVLLTYSPTNPFGRPGVDYSESFSVTSRALVYADATHYPAAKETVEEFLARGGKITTVPPTEPKRRKRKTSEGQKLKAHINRDILLQQIHNSLGDDPCTSTSAAPNPPSP